MLFRSNDTATTEIYTAQYTLSLHDALPIYPWLFEDSIEKISRDGNAGDVAVVFDHDKSVIGAGLYDPSSPVRVKMLSFGPSKIPVGLELFRKLCLEAKQVRDGKISANTNMSPVLADRKSTRLNSSHIEPSRMPSSA